MFQENKISEAMLKGVWQRYQMQAHATDEPGEVSFDLWCELLDVEATGEYKKLFHTYVYRLFILKPRRCYKAHAIRRIELKEVKKKLPRTYYSVYSSSDTSSHWI